MSTGKKITIALVAVGVVLLLAALGLWLLFEWIAYDMEHPGQSGWMD